LPSPEEAGGREEREKKKRKSITYSKERDALSINPMREPHQEEEQKKRVRWSTLVAREKEGIMRCRQVRGWVGGGRRKKDPEVYFELARGREGFAGRENREESTDLPLKEDVCSPSVGGSGEGRGRKETLVGMEPGKQEGKEASFAGRGKRGGWRQRRRVGFLR